MTMTLTPPPPPPPTSLLKFAKVSDNLTNQTFDFVEIKRLLFTHA